MPADGTMLKEFHGKSEGEMAAAQSEQTKVLSDVLKATAADRKRLQWFGFIP